MSTGTLYLTLNKNLFSPGSQVDGTISANLFQTLPGASEIVVNVKGLEETKLVERVESTEYYTENGEEKSRTVVDYRTHTGSNQFFNQTFVIYNFGTSYMPAGQYSFPVSFVLPSGLPSTFNHDFTMHGYSCYAKVNYVMKASIPTNLPGQTHSLSRVASLIVNQPFSLGSGNCRKHLNKNITSWCCCDQGNTDIVTYFEKSEYVPGETAYMIVEVDNSKCQANILEINGVFYQNLKLVAGGFSHTENYNHRDCRLNGIKAGEAVVGQNAQRLGVRILNKNGSAPQPTCLGKLVQNQYGLMSKIKLDNCECCENAPSCAIGVNIRNPEPDDPQQQLPSGWQPTVMRRYTASLAPLKADGSPEYSDESTQPLIGQPPNENIVGTEYPIPTESSTNKELAKPGTEIHPYKATMPGSSDFPNQP